MWVAQHYRFLMLSALLCYATEFQVHKKMGSEKKFRQQKKKRFLAFFPYIHDPKRSHIQKNSHIFMCIRKSVWISIYFSTCYSFPRSLDFLSDKIWPSKFLITSHRSWNIIYYRLANDFGIFNEIDS